MADIFCECEAVVKFVKKYGIKIPILRSGRHLHITKELCKQCFGREFLTSKHRLWNAGTYFVAKETLDVHCGIHIFNNVPIIGPCRKYNQFEVSLTDCAQHKIKPCLRKSGDLWGTPGFFLQSNKNSLGISVGAGVIVAQPHIHVPHYWIEDGVVDGAVTLQVWGPRLGAIHGMSVFSDNTIGKPEIHLDDDQYNGYAIDFADEFKLLT